MPRKKSQLPVPIKNILDDLKSIVDDSGEDPWFALDDEISFCDNETKPHLVYSSKEKKLKEFKLDSGIVPIENIERSELHLLKLPCFWIGKKSQVPDLIEISHHIQNEDGTEEEFLWKVLKGSHTPFPGELSKRIHREVVEPIIFSSPRPLKNPFRIGSFSDIARKLGLIVSGRTYNQIRDAILAIYRSSIMTKGKAFWSKPKKEWVEAHFHLYDGVVFTGETYENGKADAIYIWIGEKYLENYESRYVVPLDGAYYRSLKSGYAARLYELLSLKFFAALKSGKENFTWRYSRLTKFIPMPPMDKLWLAKKQMNPILAPHIESGFIQEVAWMEARRKNEWPPQKQSDWVIIYTIGPRAKAEYERIRATSGPIDIERASVEIPQLPNYSRDQLIEALILRGVQEKVANEIINNSPNDLEVIGAIMTRFDMLLKKNPGHFKTSPQAWLVGSIRQPFHISKELKLQVQAKVTEQKLIEQKEKKIQTLTQVKEFIEKTGEQIYDFTYQGKKIVDKSQDSILTTYQNSHGVTLHEVFTFDRMDINLFQKIKS